MIDAHCHLDLFSSPQEMARACATRATFVLSVTTTPSAWHGTVALEREAPSIATALGLHPQLAHERARELPLFERLLPETRFVGEIGLDGSPESRPHWQVQASAFARILGACSNEGGRILSIHSRRAATAVLDHLTDHPGAGTPILHWFSGTTRELSRAIDLGCWFSVGPSMLVSTKGRDLAARMPRERVLTESDGPFAQVDRRAALPWDAELAEAMLSVAWDMSPTAVSDQLRSNLNRLLSRP